MKDPGTKEAASAWARQVEALTAWQRTSLERNQLRKRWTVIPRWETQYLKQLLDIWWSCET